MLHNNLFYIFIFYFGLLCPLVTSQIANFYRKDYRYINEFDAYYKIQWDKYGLSMNAAHLACYNDGAELFYPKIEGEWRVAKSLKDTQCAVPNVTNIFVGVKNTDSVDDVTHSYNDENIYDTTDDPTVDTTYYESINKRTTDDTICILMDIKTGSFETVSCAQPSDVIVPYICKKVVDNCPTVDKGYILVKENKKCYKVNNKESTWLEAMQTCFMEGSTLAIIDNAEESKIISSLIPRDVTKNYFIGFRKMDPSNKLFTVKGKMLSEDNLFWRYRTLRGHTCGAINKSTESNLYTKLIDCNEQLSFICEMDVA